MWTDGFVFGSWRTRGSTDVDIVCSTVTYESTYRCHIAGMPPKATCESNEREPF